MHTHFKHALFIPIYFLFPFFRLPQILIYLYILL